MSSYSAPTRALPDKPSLAQLRKQAKELLKSYPAKTPPSTKSRDSNGAPTRRASHWLTRSEFLREHMAFPVGQS